QYLLKTRTGEYEVVVHVVGMEGKEFPGRQWTVRASSPFIQRKQMSVYGRLANESRMDAERFIGDWIGKKLVVPTAFVGSLHIDTLPLPREQRERVHHE